MNLKTTLPVLPFVVLLFILPFPGTVVVRLACLAAAFLIVVISWRRLTPPPFPCKGAIALWAGVVIASLVVAVDPAYSLGEIKNEVGYALIAFVAFFAWTRDEKQLRLSCVAVLAGFAVISGSALLGADLRKGEWPSDAYYGGVGGVSNYLVTVGPVLALTVTLFGRRHSSKWLALLGLAFGAVAVLSAQRALWPALGLQAALGCVWLWQVRGVAVGPVRVALTATILLALIGAGIYVSEQYRTGGDPESPVAMGKDLRPRVWKKVGEKILAHPLSGAGFGLGVMSKAYPALLPAEGKVFWHPHNLVLNYGVSAGVPGMVAVVVLFAALGWRFWQLALRGERLARLTGLAGAAMVAGVLARNMANDFFVRDGALLFWALAGMLFGYALRHGSTSGEDQASLQQARVIVVAEA
ncbi:MAG TPA: O-antigen ligase family protein [Candidatus Limnocylindria bacterium]|nr:O-antigen ligase family protein [Candidatus Limnocylindria bacterium]